MKAVQRVLPILLSLIHTVHNYVYTNYEMFSDGTSMGIQLMIGRYVWIYFISINMFDNYTLYDEYRYNNMLSLPIEMFNVNGTDIPVKVTSEKLVFKDESYFNFTFLNIAEENYGQYVNEMISFPLRPSNKTLAFIHQLYNTNMIDKLIMYFCSVKHYETQQEVGGTVYFGGIDESLLHGKYNVTIKPLASIKEWKVKMNKYTFHLINDDGTKETQITFPNTKEVILNIGDPYIYFPHEEYDILRNVYFKTAIDKDLCREEENSDNTLIVCKLDALEYLGDIDFVFDNSLFTFNLKNVIERYILERSRDYFVVEVCFMKSTHNNTWIFGEAFFRTYITLLDFEKEVITFYSNSMFITSDNFTVHKQIFLFISTCLLLTVIYLIIIQFLFIRK